MNTKIKFPRKRAQYDHNTAFFSSDVCYDSSMNITAKKNNYSYIDAASLQAMLDDQNEIALLDIREAAPFAEGHLWLATNIPLSCIEFRIRRFVPRSRTRLVLCDDNDGLAERAAVVLNKMGYDNIQILVSGVSAWVDAGNSLVSGNYVIAHSFGYFIEEHFQTPVITAEELMAKQQAGEDIVLVDTRAESDYIANSITNSISVPAAEVARRIPDLAPDPKTQVVVHCAGVTRAALGVQGLLNADITNPVYSLREGTRGWVLAGGTLSPNQPVEHSNRSSSAKEFSRAAMNKIAQRFKLSYINHDDLSRWRDENPDRTCYLVDVRTEQEYLAEHYPGTIWVPGGELAGMTIDHLATQGARLALFADTDCARAELTASWMKQQNWNDVVIVNDWKNAQPLASGPEPDYYPELEQLNVSSISTMELSNPLLQGNTMIIDFSPSETYRKAHIPGAVWATRSQLPGNLNIPQDSERIVVTSVNGRLARLAASDLMQYTNASVHTLEGGNNAWIAAGLVTETGLTNLLGEVNDEDPEFLKTPGMDEDAIQAMFRRNMAWRAGLYPKFKKDQPVQFTVPPQLE